MRRIEHCLEQRIQVVSERQLAAAAVAAPRFERQPRQNEHSDFYERWSYYSLSGSVEVVKNFIHICEEVIDTSPGYYFLSTLVKLIHESSGCSVWTA